MNLGYVEIKDVVLFFIAVLGAALGLYNTWKANSRDKVKLKVTPKIYQRRGVSAFTTIRGETDLNSAWDGLCIEVVNVGFIPVTVDDIGLIQAYVDQRQMWIKPQLSNGDTIPQRLEPRASFTAYLLDINPTIFQVGLKGIKCAYATTACGKTFKGNSPIFKRLIHMAV